MSVLLITHDLGVIAETCDECWSCTSARSLRSPSVESLFHDPLHPYTQALLRSIPRLGQGKSWQLEPIEGMVPDPYNRPAGVHSIHAAPSFMAGVMRHDQPTMVDLADGRAVRCLLYGRRQASVRTLASSTGDRPL